MRTAIYPNPVINNLNVQIDCKENQPYSFRIYSAEGNFTKQLYRTFLNKLQKFKRMKRFIESYFQSWKTNPPRKPMIIRGVRQVGKTYSDWKTLNII